MKIFSYFSFLAIISVALFSCKQNPDAQAGDAVEIADSTGVSFIVDSTAIINWAGSKPTGTHSGTLNVSGGNVNVANGTVIGGSFTLDMTSINVTDLEGDEKLYLETHLKGTGEEGATDFFNTSQFPTATFEIASVAADTSVVGANSMVTGNLTLVGIAKSITFPAQIDMTDNTVTVTTPAFTIDRTQWGINYSSKNIFKEIGDKFIDDNISLQINLSATKPAM